MIVRHAMKICDLRSALVFLFSAVALQALPHGAHSMKGVVHSVEPATGLVRIDPVHPGDPTSVEIVTGRTVLRSGGKPAALADLRVGDEVRIYYQREAGRVIATEINWMTPTQRSEPEPGNPKPS